VGFNVSGKPPTKEPRTFEDAHDAVRGLIHLLFESADLAAEAGELDDVSELESLASLMTAWKGRGLPALVFAVHDIQYWIRPTH
jgi:hypothetical protein